MTIQQHLGELAEIIRSGCGPVVAYEEVRQWPKGRLKELIKMGVLAKGMTAKHISCYECGDDGCHGIEPTIETNKETGETAGFFLCLKGGGLKKVSTDELQQWVIVEEKLEAIGYLKEVNEQPQVESVTEDVAITAKNAMAILGVSEGHISRLKKQRKLKEFDGKISRNSVLIYKQKQEEKQLESDLIDIKYDAAKLERRH